MDIKVILNDLQNATEQQRLFAQRTCQLIEDVLNHGNFPDAVLNSSFSFSTFESADHVKSELANQEVLNIILTGKEQGAESDHEINLIIRLKWKWSAVGSSNLGSPVMESNLAYVNWWLTHNDITSFAGHIMHEWMHIAGFYHKYGNSTRGDVPYVIGDLVRDMGYKLLLEKDDTVNKQANRGFSFMTRVSNKWSFIKSKIGF